jgi:tetratricopeptide (TPR) repeat protein
MNAMIRLRVLFLAGFVLLTTAACSARPGPLVIRDSGLGPLLPVSTPTEAVSWADARAYAAYLRSLQALREGDVDRAAQFLDIAVARDPGAVAPRLRLAGLAMLRGDRQTAVNSLSQLDLDPEQLPPPLLEAYLAWAVESGRRDRAEAALRAALRQGTLHPAILLQWVAREEDTTPPGALLEFIADLIAEAPDAAILQCVEGHLLVRLGRYKDGIEPLEICLAAFPDWLPGMLERGLTAELVGDRVQADLWYRRVLQQQPEQALAVWRLRALSQGDADAESARRQLEGLLIEVQVETALQLAGQALQNEDAPAVRAALAGLPADRRQRPRVKILEGLAAEIEGDGKAALTAFASAMTAPSPSIRRLAALQWIRITREAGDKWFDKARKRFEAAPDAEFGLAIGLALADDEAPRGEDWLQRMHERFPDHAETLYRLGVLAERGKRRADALAYMEKVLERDPDHADALNFLGYSLAEEGRDLARAESLIRRALELKPQAGYILDSLGWVLFQAGRAAEAVPYLEQALAAEGDDPVIYEHLGDAYAVLGRDDEARGAWGAALELTEDPGAAARLRDKLGRLAP